MTRRLAAALTLAAVAVVGGASTASATVDGATAYGPVTVSSRAVRVLVAADLGPQFSARGPWDDYTAEVWSMGVRGWEPVGSLTGSTPHVSGVVTLNPAQTGVGKIPLWVLDPTDGDAVRITVTLLRRTVVTRPFLEPCGTDIYVQGQVRHYDPATGALMPSKASPVRVQELTRHGWVTVRTLTSDRFGVVRGYVPSGGGRVVVRLSRPVGANVTAGTSPAAVVRTFPGVC